MTKRLCIIAGAVIFLSMGGLTSRGEAGIMSIPDVGEGQCVKPGPDGKPQPCGQEHQRSIPTTSPAPRRTRVPSQPSAPQNRSSIPCNQIPWENDQKRHCAERVQKDCKKRHTEGTKEFQECVFKGLTGEGKGKKIKVRESQKKKVKEKRGQESPKKDDKPRTGPTFPPSIRKQPRGIEVPASQTPTTPTPTPTPSLPFTTEEQSSSPQATSSSQEQCIFPFYPDCRGKCDGLPSYPTYEFEDCLTRCDQTYQAVLKEYNRCQEK